MGVDDYHGRIILTTQLTTQEKKDRLIEGLKEDIRRNIPRLNMLSESGLMMLRVSQTDVDPMIIINVVEEDRFQFIRRRNIGFATSDKKTCRGSYRRIPLPRSQRQYKRCCLRVCDGKTV